MKRIGIFLSIIFIILCLFGLDEVSLLAFAFAFTFFIGYINKNSMIALILSMYFFFFGIIIYLYDFYELNYLSLIISGFIIFVPGIVFPFVASKKDRILFRRFYNFFTAIGVFIFLLGFFRVDNLLKGIIPLVISIILYLFLNIFVRRF